MHFTCRNIGIGADKKEHAELGSCWKAAHVKCLLWYMAVKACEYAAALDVTRLHLLS